MGFCGHGPHPDGGSSELARPLSAITDSEGNGLDTVRFWAEPVPPPSRTAGSFVLARNSAMYGPYCSIIKLTRFIPRVNSWAFALFPLVTDPSLLRSVCRPRSLRVAWDLGPMDHANGPRRSAPRCRRPTADCLRDLRSLSVLSDLLAPCFRPVGNPRSLLTGRRPVRMVSGTDGPARLEAGGSTSKDAERCSGKWVACGAGGDAPQEETSPDAMCRLPVGCPPAHILKRWYTLMGPPPCCGRLYATRHDRPTARVATRTRRRLTAAPLGRRGGAG